MLRDTIRSDLSNSLELIEETRLSLGAIPDDQRTDNEAMALCYVEAARQLLEDAETLLEKENK